MSIDFNQEWISFIKSIGAKGMLWGITGGNEWVSYKQIDDNDFLVQIYTYSDFNEYKRQKDAIVDFFAIKESKLINERDVKVTSFGYWKELEFKAKQKVEFQKRLERDSTEKPFSIGNIFAPGAVINFGTISDSPITIDNTVHEIEKMIDEKGGEDKEQLYNLLNETKEMVEVFIANNQITPKKGFFERLTGHLSKHGWFYGAILQLLGTAALQIIGH